MSDDANDFDLPEVEREDVVTGAAADSVDLSKRLVGLPRLLRYAMLVNDDADYIEQRLIAEIEELYPNLALNTAWASMLNAAAGVLLAAELDRLAVAEDDPKLRGLADSVRLLCLPAPIGGAFFEDHQRVARALLLAFKAIVRKGDKRLRCDVEQFVFGWAALPACSVILSRQKSAAMNAVLLGSLMVEHRVEAAHEAGRREQEEEEPIREAAPKEAFNPSYQGASSKELVRNNHITVARLTGDEMKNLKLKEILGPLKDTVNVPLPLVEVPPLHQVRSALQFEFPYAVDVIDAILGDLVGRTTIQIRPFILLGGVGGGKSRFVRKLGEALSINVFRVDCSRSDGVFGGTDRRWNSAEPCHPFLAIARSKTANPLVLLDEFDKAPSRLDLSGGRLWDCLLNQLERETSARYPDPALQIDLDLSHVSYAATANSVDPLPYPIRDRMRVLSFPQPTAGDCGALLPAVIADLASERGLNADWIAPLDGIEHATVTEHWHGGSVRHLRRIVEAILRERDLRVTRN